MFKTGFGSKNIKKDSSVQANHKDDEKIRLRNYQRGVRKRVVCTVKCLGRTINIEHSGTFKVFLSNRACNAGQFLCNIPYS